MPGSHDFYINTALTTFAKKTTNKDFIADRLFPPIPVDKDTVILKVFSDEHLVDETDDLRGPGAPASEDNWSMGTDVTLVLQEHARMIRVPEEYEKNQDAPMNAKLGATQTLVERLMIREERAMVTLLTTAGTYSSSSFYTTPATLWDSDASDLLSDIQTGKQQVALSIGREPNVFWCGREVWSAIVNHPDVRDVVKRFGLGEAGQAAIAALFGVDEVLVGRSIYNSAKRLAASTIAGIWGKHAGLIYRNPSLQLYDMTFGLKIQGREVNRTIDESWDSMVRSTFVRIRDKYRLQVIGNKAGYWFDTPVT